MNNSQVIKRQQATSSSGSKIWGWLVSLLLIFLLLAGGGFLLLGFFSGRFGQNERFTVAVSGPKIFVLSLLTNGSGATVVYLPASLYISDVAHGYGQYELSKVYQVGELDHRGGEVFSDTLTKFLGVPVDAYVQSNRQFTDLKSYFVSPDFIFGGGSNLSLLEKIKIVREMSGLRFDKIDEINFKQSAGKVTLPDGSSALSIDPKDADKLTAEAFTEERVQSEKLRVGVVNDTSVSGLGNSAGRILANVGMTVVSLDSGQSVRKGCTVYTSDLHKQTLTVRRIREIFNCTVASGGGGRSDVEVHIGTDVGSKL